MNIISLELVVEGEPIITLRGDCDEEKPTLSSEVDWSLLDADDTFTTNFGIFTLFQKYTELMNHANENYGGLFKINYEKEGK